MKRINTISALLLIPAVWFGSGAQTVSEESVGTSEAAMVSVAQMLQGQLSGVRVSSTDGNPNGALITNIRGLNSLRGSSQPLWIVDGTELNSTLAMNNDAFWQSEFGGYGYTSALNDLEFLSPYQIESLEVLKNTSATALYGAKGANGVIIVKTKKAGTDGRIIRLNSNFGVNTTEADMGRASISHNHTVLLSQNRNRTAYSLSAFFRGNEGVLSGVRGNTAALKANFETRANAVVQFGLNTIASLGKTKSTLGTAAFGKASRTISGRYPELFAPSASDGADRWEDSYIDDADSYRSITSVFLDFNILPGLSIRTRGGMDYESQDRYIWYEDGTTFGDINNGAASILSTSLLNYNASAELTFERYFLKAHLLNIRLAADANGGNCKYSTMNATDFLTWELGAKGLAFGASKNIPRKLFCRTNQIGYSASLSYNYRGIVDLKGSVRRDTTPKYDEGDFRLYPAGELALDLHKAFFSGFKPVSGLRLEAGYGESGRETYIPSENYSDFTGAPDPGIDYDVAAYYDALNRLTTKELHAGIKMEFASGRISFSAQFYDRETDDSYFLYDNSAVKKNLVPKPILKFGDRKLMKQNVATVGNRGYEFDLAAKVLNDGDWNFDIYANAAYNVNSVISVEAGEQYCPSVGGDVISAVCAEGQSVGAFYGYRNDPDGNLLDITGDGRVSAADREVLGNPVPKCFGSLGGALSYKAFSLDFRFDTALGFDILNLNSMLRDDSVCVAEKYVEKGDYLRLANLGLSYNLPLKSKAIKGFKISASAHNLLTLTDFSGFNPDVDCFGTNNLTRGMDYGSYPMMRTFILGLQLNF